MLLQEIDRNAAKFVPEPEAQKKERKNPLPWESGMVSMMQDLKGSIIMFLQGPRDLTSPCIIVFLLYP